MCVCVCVGVGGGGGGRGRREGGGEKAHFKCTHIIASVCYMYMYDISYTHVYMQWNPSIVDSLGGLVVSCIDRARCLHFEGKFL